MRPSLFARAKVLVSDALSHPVHARLLRLLLDQAVGRSAGTVSAGNTADTMPVTSDQRPATSGCHALPSRSGWLSVSQLPANPGWAWTRGRIPVSAHGPLGYATVTIADLSGCLAVLARYRRIRTHALAWSLSRTPTGMVLQGQDCMRLARPGDLSWIPWWRHCSV